MRRFTDINVDVAARTITVGAGVKMVGIRKQIEVGLDHLTHLVFDHDSSQIMNRRQILSDAELNLSLGGGETRAAGASDAGAPGADGHAAEEPRSAVAGGES